MGADLVPVYHLGQTQLLTFWGTEQISRKWRASVGLFWGAYGLPLPRKHQIITLVGPPIPGKLPPDRGSVAQLFLLTSVYLLGSLWPTGSFRLCNTSRLRAFPLKCKIYRSHDSRWLNDGVLCQLHKSLCHPDFNMYLSLLMAWVC